MTYVPKNLYDLTNAVIIGTANFYHSTTELLQSSYEHNSQLKILQTSLPEKSTSLPTIVQNME